MNAMDDPASLGPRLASWSYVTTFLASAVSCSGDHPRIAECAYQVTWSINPHMVIGSVDHARAAEQHAALVRAARSLGATVTMLPFVHGAFDSVFAKDNALCVSETDCQYAILASPRHAVRRREQRARADILRSMGVHVDAITSPFEGGDVCILPGGCGALLGVGFRSSLDAIRPLRTLLGMQVVALELVDPALYHLDTALTVLADGTVLVCDDAFSAAALRALRSLPLRAVISVSREEAMRFALNVIEIGDTVVTGTDSPEVAAVLGSLGRRVLYTPLDEFQRAGGSAACLLAPIYDVAQRSVATAATAAIRSTAA